MREVLAPAVATGVVAVLCVAGIAASHHHADGAAHHLVATRVAAASVAVVALLAVLVLWTALRHRRLVRDLRAATAPAEVQGLPVRVGELGEVAFVAGLLRPVVFVDVALLGTLPPGQQRAVLLHERAHQRARDPLRQTVVAAVAPLCATTARGRRWLEAATARREIAADRAAMAAGVLRHDLAGALLAAPTGQRAGVAAFSPAAELRVRALLGEDPDLEGAPVPKVPALLVLGIALGAWLCVSALHGLLAPILGG